MRLDKEILSGSRITRAFSSVLILIAAPACTSMGVEHLPSTVSEYQDAYRDGSLTPVDAMRALLVQARAANEANAIFITLDEDAIVDRAQELTEEGSEFGNDLPLWGIPVSIKDIIVTRNVKTTLGTDGITDFTPSRNAAVIERLEAAGAIVFGKTNANELAYGSNGYNSHYGQTLNAYSKAHVSGGSSGGAAVSAALGLVPLAVGTDTAASIRVPAAFNGVFGFRPSLGRYDNSGISPIAHTLDVVGPLATSLDDILIFDRVMRQTERRAEVKVRLDQLRIGVPAGKYHQGVSSEVLTTFDDHLQELEHLGVTLVRVPFDDSINAADAGLYPILFSETWSDMSAFLDMWMPGVTIDELYDGLGPDVKALWDLYVTPQASEPFSEASYREARDVIRPRLQQAYADYFERHQLDAVLFPSTASTAPLAEPQNAETIIIDGAEASAFINDRNAGPGALAGLPGISYPIGRGAGGLPIGASLDGLPGRDDHLLGVTKALVEGLSIDG